MSRRAAPDGGQGSVILIDGPYYQDILLSCSATLSTNADNAGLVFGYRDRDNFWVKVWSKASQTARLYEVSGGSWTQRTSAGVSISSGVAFGMSGVMRAGSAMDYSATVPAGQVGLWRRTECVSRNR